MNLDKVNTNSKTVALGDICDITSSKRIFQHDYVDAGIPFFRTKEIKELSEGKDVSTELFITEKKYQEIKKDFDIPRPGDILVSAVGTIGVSYIVKDDKPFYFKDGNLVWLKNFRGIGSKFLNFYLNHFVRFKQSIATSGSAYNALTIVKLKDFRISLPSVIEQDEIVSKIEELFSELDKSIEELKTAQQQLKVYRGAVLKWAFEGRLTNADVKEGKLPEGWKWRKTKEVINIINNGYTPTKEFLSEGSGEVPFIKVYNLNFDGTLNFKKNPTFIPTNIHNKELKRSICLPGDVLINIVGPPLGKVSIVTNQYPEWNINQAIVMFRPNDQVLSKYLSYFMQSPVTTGWLENTSKATAGQWNVKVSTCREIPFPLCPVEEQQQIVQKIESRLSVCDKIEETITNSLKQAEALRQSVLKRAFEGKLI